MRAATGAQAANAFFAAHPDLTRRAAAAARTDAPGCGGGQLITAWSLASLPAALDGSHGRFSDLVGGGVTGSKNHLMRIRSIRGTLGSQLDPRSCWTITRCVETLVLRMKRAAQNASAVARRLANNPLRPVKVLHSELIGDPAYQVVYKWQCSGSGSTFAFAMEGGREQAFRLINGLTLFRSAVSLDGTESLNCHPASTTHSGVPAEARAAAGVSDGLIRISVGLEHPDDLVADVAHALSQC